MTRTLLLGLALLQVPASAPGPAIFSRYQRALHTSATGETCVVLDSAVFAHSEPFLKDLRLYANSVADPHEIPYVLTLSEAQQADAEPASVLNLGMRGRSVEFDLAMPARPYTEVDLDLDGENFLATASVTGSSAPGSGGGTQLGEFTLFDLTSQHLSRSTAFHLQESTFPFLHVSLTATSSNGTGLALAPQMIRGATVPPSREAQTLFTVAAQTSHLEQQGRQTVAHLNLPAHVPIERVSFTLAPGFRTSFSRDVAISSHAPGEPANSGDTFNGTIQRVNISRAGRQIKQQQLSIPAALGANLQRAAVVEVSVDNGDDPPLGITSVQLEMRQRDLCFQSASPAALTLFYGDPALPAPQYDLSRTFAPSARPSIASLGPEELNPAWRPRPDVRPFTERHPHLLWIALLCVVCVLALVAFRSSRKHLHGHPGHR